MLRLCGWCSQNIDDSVFEVVHEFRTQDVIVIDGRAHAFDRVKIEPPPKKDPTPSGDEVEEPELEEVEAKSAE